MRVGWMAGVLLAGSCVAAGAEDKLELSPTRPTIANSTGMQARGVLQVEAGYDGYPQRVPGHQEAVGTSAYYTPLNWMRLDFSWTPYTLMRSADERVAGVSTVALGTKLALVRDGQGGWLPAIGVQYEAELPTASASELQGFGQQVILLMNHHMGPFDVIANGSLVQQECQTAEGCSYGGQQSLALTYRVSKRNTLYAETFAQNVSVSATPPGTYVFGGFVHRFSEVFGVDGGMRFGLSDQSASVGATAGVFFGKRLRAE